MFEATLESLQTHEVPQWYQDARFGFFSKRDLVGEVTDAVTRFNGCRIRINQQGRSGKGICCSW